MRQLLQLERAIYLIELTCQTSLDLYLTGEQERIQAKKLTSIFSNKAVILNYEKIDFY